MTRGHRLSQAAPHLAAGLLTVAMLVALAAPASASVPTRLSAEGRLLTADGKAAPDGTYMVTFRLYASAAAKQAVWSEVVAKLTVSGGRFKHALGSATPLSAQLLAKTKAGWLGVAVANEPETSRVALRSAPMVQRAALAGGLACTGCLSMQALKADGDLNLGKGSVKAGVLAAGSLIAGDVQAQTLKGDGAKITGASPSPSSCPPNQVATGVDNAGKLLCNVAAGVGGGQIEQISGGLLTTKIGGSHPSKTTPKGIDDNNPIGTTDVIELKDLGIATALSISVHLTNSNLASVEVIAYAPDNTPYVLHKGKAGKELKETWPVTAQPVSGNLGTWIGKNPKGKWRLRVIDKAFLNNGKDGQLLSWSVNVLAKSSQMITSTGAFAASGQLGVQQSGGPPFACAEDTVGAQYWDSKNKRMYYCDGSWRELLVESLCGNGVVNSTENCDDSNTKDGDGCTSKCLKNVCGDGVPWIGKEECDDGNKVDKDACSNSCKSNFQTVTFTTCGQTGRLGPAQGKCDSAYAGNTWLKGKVKLVAGVQNWTVPFTGAFTIEAYGARGGYNGANGARMKGSFQFKAGQVLQIVVGQMGIRGSGGGGGGGGGTFVYTGNTLHIAAGGGGGKAQSGSNKPGVGSTAPNGSKGVTSAAGGNNGAKGGGGHYDGASPGAGWNGGDTTNYSNNDVVGAKSRPTWLGAQSNRHNYKSHGGFGGGGASIHPGGGGGGYGGGGAGAGGGGDGRGGGGAFNAGAHQSNTSGANASHGKVIITSP